MIARQHFPGSYSLNNSARMVRDFMGIKVREEVFERVHPLDLTEMVSKFMLHVSYFGGIIQRMHPIRGRLSDHGVSFWCQKTWLYNSNGAQLLKEPDRHTQSHTDTHAHTHAQTHRHTHTHTQCHTKTHTHTLTHSHTTHSHTRTHTLSHTHKCQTHTHNVTHSHTNKPTFVLWRFLIFNVDMKGCVCVCQANYAPQHSRSWWGVRFSKVEGFLLRFSQMGRSHFLHSCMSCSTSVFIIFPTPFLLLFLCLFIHQVYLLSASMSWFVPLSPLSLSLSLSYTLLLSSTLPYSLLLSLTLSCSLLRSPTLSCSLLLAPTLSYSLLHSPTLSFPSNHLCSSHSPSPSFSSSSSSSPYFLLLQVFFHWYCHPSLTLCIFPFASNSCWWQYALTVIVLIMRHPWSLSLSSPYVHLLCTPCCSILHCVFMGGSTDRCETEKSDREKIKQKMERRKKHERERKREKIAGKTEKMKKEKK